MSHRNLWSWSALILAIAVDAAAALEKQAQGYDKKAQDYDKGSYKGAASIFAMEYLPIGHVRTDPILSRECLSDHVHTFYGPPLLHPSVTSEEMRSARRAHKTTSGNVLENQSLYCCVAFPVCVVRDCFDCHYLHGFELTLHNAGIRLFTNNLATEQRKP